MVNRKTGGGRMQYGILSWAYPHVDNFTDKESVKTQIDSFAEGSSDGGKMWINFRDNLKKDWFEEPLIPSQGETFESKVENDWETKTDKILELADNKDISALKSFESTNSRVQKYKSSILINTVNSSARDIYGSKKDVNQISDIDTINSQINQLEDLNLEAGGDSFEWIDIGISYLKERKEQLKGAGNGNE